MVVPEVKPAPKKRGWRKRLFRWPSITIDLNQPRQRRVFFFSLAGALVLSIAFLVGGYKTFEYTESAEFCG
ncbi:MAG: cytochrome C, partial [Caldilineae bacterium]